MNIYHLLLFMAMMFCTSAFEAEINQKVKVKDKSYTCSFKMRYEENTCLDTSKVFCSPKVKGKKIKSAKDIKLVTNDGTIIYIKKVRFSKRKKAKIIGCKVVSPIAVKTIEKTRLFTASTKRHGSTMTSSSCGNNSISCIQADVDIDVLKYGNTITLPNNVTMALTSRTDGTATYETIEHNGEGVFSWSSEGCLDGQVDVLDHKWNLKSCVVSTGKCSDCYVWEELDNNWEMEMDDVRVNDGDSQMSKNKIMLRTAQDRTTIVTYTLNVWYTPEFASLYSNDLSKIDTRINKIVGVTNKGYINSNIPVRVEKRCVIQHPTLHDIPDGDKLIEAFGDSMSKSESARSADVNALLVVSLGSLCGKAMGYGETRSCRTYLISVDECATKFYSFGHEVAHIFGAKHNPEVYTSKNQDIKKPKYGHGHLIQPRSPIKEGGYRTIMAYQEDGHRIRKNYYSNPDVTFPDTGQPTGTTTLSNNARLIMEERFNMAACGDESLLCPATKSSTGAAAKCFSSPGYPGKYPDNSDITQTISVPAGHSMEITFEHFAIEDGWSRCPYDYVEFLDGSGNTVGGKRCGSNLPKPFTIGSSTASVIFHSDSGVKETGFKFCYRPIAALCSHTDKGWECPYWKKEGYCKTNAWVVLRCAKSCKC